MLGIVNDVKQRARQTARVAALSVVGAVFCLVGLGFLTTALWIIIEIEYGALMAALLLGGLYLVLGGAILAFGGKSQSDVDYGPSDTHPESPPSGSPKDPIFQMAEGFAVGLQAGREARKGG